MSMCADPAASQRQKMTHFLNLESAGGQSLKSWPGVLQTKGLLLTSLCQLFPDANMPSHKGRRVKEAGVARLQSQNVDQTLKYTSVTRSG